GDSKPRVGDMAIRRRDRRAAGPNKLLPIDAPVRDVSHFNVLDGLSPGEKPRVVKHIVGNVQKFLHTDGEEDHGRNTRALGLKNGQLGTSIMATAGADCSMSPSDSDILNQHPIDGYGLIGILPVIPLRSAACTPSIASLTARPRR